MHSKANRSKKRDNWFRLSVSQVFQSLDICLSLFWSFDWYDEYVFLSVFKFDLINIMTESKLERKIVDHFYRIWNLSTKKTRTLYQTRATEQRQKIVSICDNNTSPDEPTINKIIFRQTENRTAKNFGRAAPHFTLFRPNFLCALGLPWSKKKRNSV